LKISSILGFVGLLFVLDFVLRISDFDLGLLGKIMAGEKILLVEDNPVNRRLAVFLLRAHGYEVREATTGLEALEMLEKERPDLIVMDIQLPGMDGLEVTRKIKAQPATADIPVIAVTSYAMKGDREKALAAGCVGYVTKPIDKNIFIREIAARLGEKSKIEDRG
jgi:two-component system, cell cycle response regulator DivK